MRTLVRDSDEGAPTIRTGGVGDSYPPTCGEVELANWSWDRVDREFSTGGVRWGTFHFYGQVHRGRFSLTGFAE